MTSTPGPLTNEVLDALSVSISDLQVIFPFNTDALAERVFTSRHEFAKLLADCLTATADVEQPGDRLLGISRALGGHVIAAMLVDLNRETDKLREL